MAVKSLILYLLNRRKFVNVFRTSFSPSDNFNVYILCSVLPWKDCNNEWNTEYCRDPYDKPFNESCKLSEKYYPCSDVGAKYRDCAVIERFGIFLENIFMEMLILEWRNRDPGHLLFLGEQGWSYDERVCQECD